MTKINHVQGRISVIRATRLSFQRWFDPIFHHPILLLAQSEKIKDFLQLTGSMPSHPLEKSIIGCETEKLIRQVCVSFAGLLPLFVILRYYFLLL